MTRKIFHSRSSLSFWAALTFMTLIPAAFSAAAAGQSGSILVEAEGCAPVKDGGKNAAREEAKRAACRDALEKTLGSVVTGITEMQNYEVVKDKVFSQTQGIVKGFEVTSEKVGDDGIFYLTGVCEVGILALDGVLGPAVLDAMGNPRVMALIDERIGGKQPFLSTAEEGVLGVFEKAGFILVNQDQARALLNITPSAAYDEPGKLMNAARTLKADVVILGKAYGSAFTQQNILGQSILGLRSTVQLKAVLTQTAYQIGSQAVEKKTKGLTLEDGVVKGFQEAAPEAARGIVHKVAYALASGSAGGVPGMTVKIRITGISFEESESILERLREMAGKSGGAYDRGFSDGLFEIDVVSEKNVRNVASFLAKNGFKIRSINGQIIDGEVSGAPETPQLQPVQFQAGQARPWS